ncbi:hypothetical protein IWW50_006023 [Coemansia erecta]|nr:hypothetical protein GGF43_004333 [Coemansia sp. RSA 2618]KAJ2817854.1 hypothetical protein IWW50_006023 [Coemansia erecta]
METADHISESWCSVHYPDEPTEQHAPALKCTKDQRVADWLQTLHTAQLPSVRYEQTSAPKRMLHAVELSIDTRRARQRSLSDASLADFLSCRGPHRPSFLDQRRPASLDCGRPAPLEYSRPSLTVQHKQSRRAKLSASDPAVSKQRTPKKPRRRVGWTATRLDGSTTHDYTGSQHAHTHSHPDRAAATPQSRPSEAEHAEAKAEGSAEFLGHAFQHFVAFQPLDFAPRSPEAAHGPSLANIASAGLASIRTYLSGMLDELSRDDAMFIQ